MKPLISVIVPVYNVYDFLNPCMESIVDQTYKNIEIIIVDDGSTDNSGVICDEWGNKDERIIVLHKKNGGLSDARNKGIEIAKGDYLVFVDSDDVIAESLIDYLYSLLVSQHAEIAICDPVHCYPKKGIVYDGETDIRRFNSDDAICEMLYQTSFLPSAWGKIYKSDLFKDIEFPFGMLFEDVAIMYKLFSKAKNIAYGNAKLYGYMHRENSITTKKFSKRDCDILEICSEQLTFAENKAAKVFAAAKAYSVVGALRIYLNAPGNGEYEKEIEISKNIIKRYSNEVLRNKYCRRKLKISIILYKYFRPLMKPIYVKVNRWE